MYVYKQNLRTYWLYALIILASWTLLGSEFLSHHFNMIEYNFRRLILLLYLSVLPLVIIFSDISVPNNKIYLASITLLLGIGCISCLLSDDINKSFAGFWLIISLIMTATIFHNYEIHKTAFIIVLCLFTLGVLYYNYIFYINLILDYSENKLDFENAYPYHGYSNPRYFNQLQTWCLPFLVLAYLSVSQSTQITHKLKSYLKPLIFFSTATYISLIFITEARGTLVAYMLSIPLLWFYLGRKFNAFGAKFLLLWIASIALYLVISGLIPLLLEINLVGSGTVGNTGIVSHSDNGRLHLWRVTIDSIAQNPIFGIGPIMFGSSSGLFGHPHNSILWFAVEWGIIGALIFTSVSAYLLFTYLKSVKQVDIGNLNLTLTSHTLSLSLVSAIIHSFVSGVYLMPASQILGLLVIILSLSNYSMIRSSTCSSTQLNLQPIHITKPFKLAIVSLLILLLVPTYRYIDRTDWGITIDTSAFWIPGFWIQSML